MNLEFAPLIFERYSNFMKFCSVGAELFYVNPRRDRPTKLIVAFRNFANVLKTSLSSYK